jgi:hypothetical protein
LVADVVVWPAGAVVVGVEVAGVTVGPEFPPPMVEVKAEDVGMNELVPKTVVVLTAVAL